MVKTITKLVSLSLAALVALPAMAGDFGVRPFPRHHGGIHAGNHGSPVFRPNPGWSDSRIRLAQGYNGFGHHHGWRNPVLKRVSPAYTRAGNSRANVVLVVQPQQTGNYGSVYAGSSYAYGAEGGTYVVGSGYGGYEVRREQLAPKAKVIEVTEKTSACSYEAGVCVIRP